MQDLKISDWINNEMPLTLEERMAVDRLIPIKFFEKGCLLLKEGSIAKACFFTIKGCVRSYQVVDGAERTTQFFVEGDPIAPLVSYLNRLPATHYLECIEDCTLAVLGYENEQRLYKEHPKFEALCRNSIEQEFGKQQEILQHFLTKSPEERYLLLQKKRPDLLQRVPQYHLATFLGVQPESLSRIRKRIAQKR